mgnify:CR=1 FL=1
MGGFSLFCRMIIFYPTHFILLASFALSCTSLKEPEFLGVENIRLERLSRNGSALHLDIRFYNPNKAKLKLKEASGKAWLDNDYLGEFRLDSLVRIYPKSEFSVPFSLQTKTGSLLQNTLSLLLKKEVTIKLDGMVKAGKGMLFINYPVKYEGKQELEKMLK